MDEGKDDIKPEETQGKDIPDTEHASGHGFIRQTWEVVRVLLISLAIVFPVRYFIAQPFIVRGASMEPNFQDSQYLIVDEASYYMRAPHRDEVIIFHYPKDTRQFFIKRIVGLPGERIQITKGRVMIAGDAHANPVLLDEPYLNPPNHPTYPDSTVTLGASEYFVMGDNRDYSSDSRFWGPLDKKYIVGRAFFRAWPVEQFGSVTK